MTHLDAGHYAGKHPPDTQCDARLTARIRQEAAEGTLACAAAHALAAELGISPGEVGVALDLEEIRIIECQLGLFGHAPAKKIVTPAEVVADELAAALGEASGDSRIACAACWAVARRLGLRRMEVAAACETLALKIAPCQLGAFTRKGGGGNHRKTEAI
jgi:hypothetical protein